MNVKDFVQSDSVYHPDADAWLVLGRNEKGRFCTGWVARHKPDKIISCRRFLDESSAHLAFTEIIDSDDVPFALVNAPDWQKQRLYDWEEDHLAATRTDFKNQAEARRLMRQIAADYEIDCPRLKWGAFTNFSEYNEDDNIILFGARDNATLLHEMAHAIHYAQHDEYLGPHHSPGFVSIVLDLYQRYGGADHGTLYESAGQAGLLGGLYQPENSSPKPKPPRAGYDPR